MLLAAFEGRGIGEFSATTHCGGGGGGRADMIAGSLDIFRCVREGGSVEVVVAVVVVVE